MARRRKDDQGLGLIKSVEVAYFRSFYKVNFYPAKQINIFFGENDTGKSNVMRALNLFFNGNLGDGNDFDFDIDLSTKRRDEAGAGGDVRKFVYVKIVFRAPPAHREALGSEFYVKRTWSQTTGLEFRQEVSSNINTPGKQQSLTKFLSKIKFKYIPAVKDRDVYENLLIDTYKAISKTEAFGAALAAFTAEIRNQTAALSKRLGHSLGMSSELSPPTDLADLFGSLDFETLIAGGSTMSLLRQRGDGIQARHIPELMAFAAELDSKSFHIWGIEEPENSLSMNSALGSAERLRSLADGPNIQIFITTHSPAFYSLSGDNVAKFFLKSSGDEVNVLDGASSDAMTLMGFMGDKFYLPLVAESLKKAEERAKALEEGASALRAKVAAAERPILFVEGASECLILAEVARVEGVADRFEIVSLDGTSHAERLSSLTQPLVATLLGERRGFVLLDSDKAGRNALPKSLNRAVVRQVWTRGPTDIYWRMLSPTDEARSAFRAAGISDDLVAGVTLEDCYSSEVKGRAIDAGVLALDGPRDFVHTRADLFVVSPALSDGRHKFYLNQINEGTKTRFAKWLIAEGRAACEPLRAVIRELVELLPAT